MGTQILFRLGKHILVSEGDPKVTPLMLQTSHVLRGHIVMSKGALGNYYNRSRTFFDLCHLRISKRNSKWLEWFTSTANWSVERYGWEPSVESGGSMDGSLLGPSLFIAWYTYYMS